MEHESSMGWLSAMVSFSIGDKGKAVVSVYVNVISTMFCASSLSVC